ncbi:uncharacterized protein VTP21DRAFT_1339 [Calcarisporiella thermophila]|uniref:uncharacterized protein n=1 Tax=Calcarisporiella thermophila TaxID=911321 RepID=UPI0037439DAB
MTFTMNKEFWSNALGYLSIFCWIVVLTPQLLQNYKRKSGNGLSWNFLIIWLLGDIFNLLGAGMQGLMFTMLLLAGWFIVSDVLLILQVFYYRKQPRCSSSVGKPCETSLLLPSAVHPSFEEEKHTSSNPPSFVLLTLFSLGALALLFFFTYAVWGHRSESSLGATIFAFQGGGLNHTDTHLFVIAQILGWVSTVLYIASRIPQILKNARERSCEGLSALMFLFMVLGDLTYCLSILLFSTEARYLALNLPWIAGSLGTLVFDFVILAQLYHFRHPISHTRLDPKSLC